MVWKVKKSMDKQSCLVLICCVMVMKSGRGCMLRGRARFKPFVGSYKLVKL